jgi:hypothetical protein
MYSRKFWQLEYEQNHQIDLGNAKGICREGVGDRLPAPGEI